MTRGDVTILACLAAGLLASVGAGAYIAGGDNAREQARAEKLAESERRDRALPVGPLGELARKCEGQGGSWTYERGLFREDDGLEFRCIASWTAKVKP